MKIDIIQGSFSYHPEDKILEGLSLSMEEGKFLCILGQNGIGKTTLLKCLTGFLKFQNGVIRFNGKEVCGVSQFSEVAYVPQAHPSTFPYTAIDMVCMGRTKKMGIFAMPSRIDQKIALERLNEVGIAHLAERKCSQMSGGQLQLVYIARALAADPKLLILDEPESHLDFKNQAIIIKRLKQLVREKKISCIMNTHHPEHAMKIADYILLLGKNGKYVFGQTEKVLNAENIECFFDVKAQIIDLNRIGINEKAFILKEV